jgi:hypothetical protein
MYILRLIAEDTRARTPTTPKSLLLTAELMKYELLLVLNTHLGRQRQGLYWHVHKCTRHAVAHAAGNRNFARRSVAYSVVYGAATNTAHQSMGLPWQVRLKQVQHCTAM